MKKLAKTILIALGSLAGIFFLLVVTVQLVLSEKTLTGLVNRYAVEFVDADVSFGRVKLSLVRDFPRWSLLLEDVSVTYPSDRFAAEDSVAIALSRMARSGKYGHYRPSGRRRGAPQPVVTVPQPADSLQTSRDTLASIALLKVVLKASDFWEKGTIHVPLVELRKPHIYAKDYGTRTNWDIFKSDTSAVEDTARGSLNLPAIHVNRIQLLDEPRVFYCSVPDTLFASVRAREMVLRSSIRTDDLHNLRGRFTIDSLFVAGRLKKDTVFFGLHSLELSRRPDTVRLSASARAALATALLGRTRVPIDIEANIVKKDSAHYFLSLDKFTLSVFDVPLKASGNAWYDKGRTGVDVQLGTADETRLYAYLKGGSRPLKGGDVFYDIDAALNADLQGLLALSPDKLPLEAAGKVKAFVKGGIRQSQLSLSQFAKADLQGRIFSRQLDVAMPADTLTARIDSLDIRLGAEGRQFREGGKVRRQLTLAIGLDSLQANYKNLFDVSGKRIDVRAFNSAAVLTDKERKAFYPFAGSVAMRKLRLKDTDGMVVVLRDSKQSFSVRPKRGQRQTPILSLRSNNGRLFYRGGADRYRLRNFNLDLRAEMNTVDKALRREAFLDTLALRYPDVPRDSLFRHWLSRRTRPQMPDYLSEADFRKKDLHFSLPGTLDKYFREWDLSGSLGLSRLTAVTPSFPLKTDMTGLTASFTNDGFVLDSLQVLSGKSDLRLSGKLGNLKRFLAGRGAVKLDVDLQSRELDGDELMAAWQAGRQISQDKKDSLALLDDDSFDRQVAEIEVDESRKESSLLVVPANIQANLEVNAGEIRYNGLELYSVNTDIAVQERTARITNTMATSDIGSIQFEGFYATRTKQDIKAGLNLSLIDVTAERVIELFPAIDTLMPLLSNFSGLLSCDLAVRSQIDTNMNLIIPTAKGVMRIEGQDLQIYDTPQFTKLAKTLMFKDKNVGYVNHLKVEGVLEDGKVEIFPFALTMDRYSLAMSGTQNVNTDFNYHVSIIKSPLLIKFGVDLWGNFDDWHFALCRAKYKNLDVPVFSKTIDESRISLSKAIGSIFSTGVEQVMKDNSTSERLKAIRKESGYVPAERQQRDTLSTADMETLKQAQEK